MPLFLYVTCRGWTEIIDICLAFRRPTQSHDKRDAIFLAHSMLDLKSVYSQCMTHMNREDEYIIQQLIAPSMCV